MTAPKLSRSDEYISDYDAILKTMNFYTTGLQAGTGETQGKATL